MPLTDPLGPIPGIPDGISPSLSSSHSAARTQPLARLSAHSHFQGQPCLPQPCVPHFYACSATALPSTGLSHGHAHLLPSTHTVPASSPGVSDTTVRQPGKSPHFSVNWVAGTADVEVLDTTTGRRSCGAPSRLCKHELATRWAHLYGKVSRDSGRLSSLGPQEPELAISGFERGSGLIGNLHSVPFSPKAQ